MEEFGTRFCAEGGRVILFLRHDPPAVIIPEGVTADEAAREFVRLANQMFLEREP